MIGVFIVDDDFMVARVHAAFVNQVEGFEVVGTAHTGQATREALQGNRDGIDLLLLDLYLPDIFGLDLLAELRATTTVDVLVITAAREAAAVRDARRLGVVDYLLKPFTAQDIAARLRRYAAEREAMASHQIRDQDDVDRVFVASSGAVAAKLPKGLSPQTADLLLQALANASEAMSATQAAEQIGVSRVSARRYLEHFANTGRAQVNLRYGNAGRPERLYRATSTAG